jgi:HD-GYP domain-containing protein (c-di-GMP phosphodiesterase class II)
MKKIDDIFQQKILTHGKSLINNFSILVKLTGVYDSMNDAVMNAAGRVLKGLEVLIGEEGELTIRLADDSYFIEDSRVKASLSDIDNFMSLAKDLNKRKIGVITFKSPLQADDLVYLAYAIKGGSEASEVQSILESRLTKGISVGGPLSVLREQSIDLKDTRMVARRAYTKAISAFKDINTAMKTGRKMNLKKAKRAFQSLSDCILKDGSYVLGLTTIRDTKNYYYNHSVNVAVLSMALGMRVGLSKYHLSRLGIAALFHDVGMTQIPQSILTKKGEFSKKERELIEMHPVEGVRQILRTWGLNDMSVISMLSSYEHHINLDLSGYPRVAGQRKIDIISRIIKIADNYDSLVSGKVYGRTPYRPEEALKEMYEKTGLYYDPALLKAFIDIFSTYKQSF